jgi:nucleotide-binding universal stress UspA family protein
MYNVIMVPTDGSGFDREAIRVALRIAERSEAKVRLARVLATGSFFSLAAAAEGTAIAAELVRSERDRALSELYALAAECRASVGADISVDLHTGPVADVLQQYAARHAVDLIVMSTHGRTGISRLSLGSVTDSLIRNTSVPVLVVKPPASYLNPQVADGFKHFVVPLDGSTLAEQILPRVTTMATLEEASVTLLHVLTSESRSHGEQAVGLPVPDEKISIAREYLARIAKRLRRAGVAVRTEILERDEVAEAIGEFAVREKVDLVAIATHGRGGMARLLRGSVADAVMHSGTTSMLVFKPDKPAERAEAVSSSWPSAELLSI